jgi:ABC-2 type transport system ATP-binding protein
VVEVTDLTVRYDGFTLGPLSLSLRPGERVALVGPNGAGKSTTLRAISGRLSRYDGSVKVLGSEAREASVELRGRVGVLGEELLGFGWMTVGEHFRLLASFYPTWDEELVARLARRTGLPWDHRLANLSKGTRVKTSLVAAVAFRPELLLLDEPTSGIDPVMRAEILSQVHEYAPPGGERALVFSTHILEDVETLADRVILLLDGRVVRDGSAEELRRREPGRSLSAILLGELDRA